MSFANAMRMLLLAAVWGGSFLFMRVAAPVLGAIPTTFGRVGLATVALAGLLVLLRKRWDFRGKLGVTMLLGVLNSGLPFVLFSWAALVLPAGYSAILNATSPLTGVIVGALFFGDRITLRKALGVVLGLCGVAVLARTGPLQFNHQVLLGVAACLGATTCYAFGGFLTRRWIGQRGGLDSSLVSWGSQLGALLMLTPVALWDLAAHPVAWSSVPANVWWSVLALGLACTAFAYLLYYWLIADVGPIKALSVTFLIPVFGVLWGWLFLNEPLSGAYAVGGGLIAVALVLVLRQGRQAAA